MASKEIAMTIEFITAVLSAPSASSRMMSSPPSGQRVTRSSPGRPERM
jgi:hypothetical protein